MKADHWVNVDGTWYGPGQEYKNKAEAVQQHTAPQPVPEAVVEKEEPQPVRRGRKRKADK